MTFDELIDVVEKSVEFDEWVKERGIAGYLEEIKGEVEEAEEALEQDAQHFREEMGDILFDWLHACKLAESKGMFTVDALIAELIEKIHRRKPYIKEGRKMSKEEAVRIWKEAKKEENGS